MAAAVFNTRRTEQWSLPMKALREKQSCVDSDNRCQTCDLHNIQAAFFIHSCSETVWSIHRITAWMFLAYGEHFPKYYVLVRIPPTSSTSFPSSFFVDEYSRVSQETSCSFHVFRHHLLVLPCRRHLPAHVCGVCYWPVYRRSQ